MVQLTVEPGGSSGWHSHPGGAIIVVKQGRSPFTKRSVASARSRCTPRGQAFLERPGGVDQVTNNGTIPYTLLVTFPRVPEGGSPRIDHQPDPGTCPGL